MKIKIQETWYEMRDDHVRILHETAANFQDYYWTRKEIDETIKLVRAYRESKNQNDINGEKVE